MIRLKREIEVFDYAGEILKALPKGMLLTTEAEDCINAMTIGWGTLGIEWGVPIFAAYIREGRFTNDLLQRTGDFTVCIPFGEKYAKAATKAIGICGSRSGRDADKLAQAGVTLVDADIVRPPAIKELPLTLECRTVFTQTQPIKNISDKFSKFYPQGVDSSNTGANEDPHVAYYGEILKAYIIEE